LNEEDGLLRLMGVSERQNYPRWAKDEYLILLTRESQRGKKLGSYKKHICATAAFGHGKRHGYLLSAQQSSLVLKPNPSSLF